MKKTKRPLTPLELAKIEAAAYKRENLRAANDRDAARVAAKLAQTRAEKAEREREDIEKRLYKSEKEHKAQLERNDILYGFVRDGGMNVRTIINDVLSPAAIKASV